MVIMSYLPLFVITSLARVWHRSWSPVRSLCRFCMSALGLVLCKHRPNENYTLFYTCCNTWKSNGFFSLLLMIVCLCYKGIHIPSLWAFYGNVSDRARHFSNLCDIYKVVKVVHGNQLNNHCNQSDTWPSKLHTTRAVLANTKLPSPLKTHTHTHMHTHARTHACTHKHTHSTSHLAVFFVVVF